MLEPPATVLVDLLQGNERVTPGESVTVGSLVIWIAQVKS